MTRRSPESLRAKMAQLTLKSDLVLLLNSHLFIPKKLLRDAIREAFAGRGGERLIDLGCGLQPYRQFLSGYQLYVGIDLDAGRRPTVVAQAPLLPLADSVADAVLCSEVLEHTESPAEVLQEIARLLRPDALLVLTAPMCWGLHYEPCDYWRFTRYGLEKLIEDAGCRVIRVRRLGGLFALIGSRLADVIYCRIAEILRPLPAGRHIVPMSVVAPINGLFYLLSCLADDLDRQDAFGWVVLAARGQRPGMEIE